MRHLRNFVWCVLVLGLCLVLAISVGMVIYFIRPLPMRDAVMDVQIPAGTSVKQIASLLTDAGVLAEPYRFLIAVKLTHSGQGLQAGDYQLHAPLQITDLLNILKHGSFQPISFQLVEGKTFADMRQQIDALPGIRHDTVGLSDSALMAQLTGTAQSPEGWFFPDTYYITPQSSDLALYQRAYASMQTHLATTWANCAPHLPYTSSYQALIMASIIEKETGASEERPMIAAVFINRLQLGMRLQTDPTVIYGMGNRYQGNLHKQDLLQDTPYNTYTRGGLPPTPIALPGLASLQAACHPAQSQALYFVANGQGKHVFSSSLRAHNQAVRQYQLKH